MDNIQLLNKEKLSFFTAGASMLASFVAALACAGPLVGIALGITGLGWLSQFSALTLPASVLSVFLVFASFYVYTTRKISCVSRSKRLFYVWFMIAAAITAISVNVFEYIVLPSLA